MNTSVSVYKMEGQIFMKGEKFTSYEEIQNRIVSYSKQHYVDFYTRSSRSLTTAAKSNKITIESASKNKKLKYYELDIACIHGGKNYKSRSKGIRESKTFQQKCPCSISFRLSECGAFLVVSKCLLEHKYHDVSSTTYKYYAKVRKLDESEKLYVEEMLKLGANPKKLLNQLSIDSGKAIVLKDIRNIAQESKRKKHNSRNLHK